MAFKVVYHGKDFSLIYLGEGGTPHEGRGGHLYQVEPAAIATQSNTLIAEMPRDIVEKAAGGFAINFSPTQNVYQDEGEIFAQGEIYIYQPNGIKVFYDKAQNADAVAFLTRIQCTDGLLISKKNKTLWHEARLYVLNEDGTIARFHVLGYVPLTGITKFETADGLVDYDPYSLDW